ncbi:NUDIX domain-containing protein [Actinomadura sp. HBU206391]|uniref:NUDIX domain-containing protein n=1 Tax=Actinomadura sp. HBU206391 TaxID=2731692 RepID=UPI00164F8F0B|nr:NUDIX hydrolase [Actinomadura sp. HBU206391]MBC6460241.1 NUDIX hydrolase [Actinomadura sp. HBU206391]
MIQTATTVVYKNRWISLREDRIRLPDGSAGIYTVIDKPTAALIIPMEGDGFHLIEQFRYPLGRRSWEFPQGTWPDERQTPAEELARAELAEETGLRAGTLHRLGRLALAPGISSQECDAFLATELTAGPTAREHTEQGMTQHRFGRDEVEEMIRGGEITDSPTIAAYMLLRLHEEVRTGPR